MFEHFLLLHALSYVAGAVAFVFCTLSLASGLLYVAEVIEEHSKMAKTVGTRTIYGIILLHALLYASDDLPLHLCLFGVVCQLVYLTNFSRTWPFISLTSLQFIGSCAVVLLNHFLWFFYFSERAKTAEYHYARHRSAYRPSWDPNPRSKANEPLSFMDVATFFGICVWLVPFYLFLSLSANDNVLPSQASAALSASLNANSLEIRIPSTDLLNRRSSILKRIITPVVGVIPSISRGRTSRRQRHGIIASPGPSSPIASAPGSPISFWGSENPSYPSSPRINPQALRQESPSIERLTPKRSQTLEAYLDVPGSLEGIRGEGAPVRRVVSTASLLRDD